MRKAVFFNFPTHGCINSLLGTAKELVDRGEKIIYYCTEEFQDKIEQTGAEFRPYKGELNKFEIINDDMFKALKSNIDMTLEKLELNYEEIRKENPDYIIHDSLCTWGKHIAKLLRLPAVNLMHSFPMTTSSMSPDLSQLPLLIKVGLYKINNYFDKSSAKNILKNKYNITLSLSDSFLNLEDLNIIYTSKHMAPDIAASEKSYYFVGPSLFFKKDQSNFPFSKLEGKKVIYISLGTLHTNNPKFYNTCRKSFINTDFFVVMSIGKDIDNTIISAFPDNFLIQQSVPQQTLLNHVDLFITHSGMNSVNESIHSSVPMLLIPHQFEQKMIAQRVSDLGMGIMMGKKRISPKKLFNAVSKIFTNPAFKDNADRYGSIFKNEEKVSHIKAADIILKHIDNKLDAGIN